MKKTARAFLSLIIAGAFILPSLSEAQEPSFILKVITEQANIREKPDLSSTLICQVPQNSILESFGKTGEWYLVRLRTDTGKYISGYVHESLVLRIKEDQPVTPTEVKQEKIIEKEVPEKKEEKPVIQTIPVVRLPERAREFSYALSFYAGGHYLSGEDLNKGTRGFAEFYDDELRIKGEVEGIPLHLSFAVGGELAVALTPQFLLAIGVDYLRVQKNSVVEYETNSTKATLSSRPTIQAIPVRIVLAYYLFPSIYLKGGVEYYFARCTYFNRYDYANSWEEKSGLARGSGMGIFGGAGAELTLASNLSFLIEATGRFARINRLKGSGTRMNSNGFTSEEEGALWLYHRLSSNQNSFPQVEIRGRKPAAGGEVDPRREAFLDFSGIGLKMGFKIIF